MTSRLYVQDKEGNNIRKMKYYKLIDRALGCVYETEKQCLHMAFVD
jgi:hypothetical protein